MNEKLFEDLREILVGYTGSITLHVENGSVKKFEMRQIMRPKGNGLMKGVELTEVGKDPA